MKKLLFLCMSLAIIFNVSAQSNINNKKAKWKVGDQVTVKFQGDDVDFLRGNVQKQTSNFQGDDVDFFHGKIYRIDQEKSLKKGGLEDVYWVQFDNGKKKKVKADQLMKFDPKKGSKKK